MLPVALHQQKCPSNTVTLQPVTILATIPLILKAPAVKKPTTPVCTELRQLYGR